MKAWTAVLPAIALGCLAFVVPASAQKAKDTVRLAQVQTIPTIDAYLDPRPEVYFLRDAVYDTLIAYDYGKREFVPLLAKAWRRVDDKTLEFDLRDDVTWHDGKPFDADDVVYTINYLVDPDVALRAKRDYEWMTGAEKLGPYKVRLNLREGTPSDLALLSTQIQIYPKHVHGPLQDKVQFGQKPVGTGPYKVAEFDRNKGILLQKREAYPQGSAAKGPGRVGNIRVVSIADAGARVAELLAGNIDVTRDIPANQADNLEKSGRFAVDLGDTFAVYYLMVDSRGRSGLKPLQDERVRRAIFMAIKHDDLAKVLVGSRSNQLQPPNGLCDPSQAGCVFTVKPPPYDPEGARKLLVEAGYADGFDVTITTVSFFGGRLSEVISGALRKIGIRAKVNTTTFAAYRDLQRDGKLEMMVNGWGGGSAPDVAFTLDFLFTPGDRDYHGSEEVFKLVEASRHEMDRAKRDKMTSGVFDIATQMNYLIPITRYPTLWVHTKELAVSGFDVRPMAPWGLTYEMLSWN